MTGAGQAVPLGADLARRVVPQLRAKAAVRAVELFLTRDALAATSSVSSCPTGRDAFRLYGV